MKKNIILADCEKTELETLKKGIEEVTGEKFEIHSKVCNGKRNFLYNIYRYLCYIFFPLKFFLKRKNYNLIICWQQFYAIFFAFYCNLFKVKKQNKIMVCSFIYKEKKGLIGKLYKSIMTFCMKNDYIDFVHILSNEYAEKASKQFKIPKEKFLVTSFGIDDTYEKYKDTKSEYENYALAIGRSNRDYDFLIRVWKNIPNTYKLVIICDEYKQTEKLPSNIILRKDIGGEKQDPYIVNSNVIIIPLKDGNICSGETVLLKSMSFSKPIIITKPSTLAEMYIKNGENGFALKKDEKEFAKVLISIFNDKEKLTEVSKCARKCFEEKYSRYNMGKIIGKKIK